MESFNEDLSKNSCSRPYMQWEKALSLFTLGCAFWEICCGKELKKEYVCCKNYLLPYEQIVLEKMDRRCWLWEKKSSEKPIATANKISQGDQDNSTKAVTYVQLPQEKYAHLVGLEDEVKVLNDKLSTAFSELTSKEELVKQHTKVAEEAVSGWENAEAEASSLKGQLESLTLLKLTAEERAAHLDGALKECMREVRNVKEEGEQKLHDVVFAKTKQWEKVKSELEAKINTFERELLQTSAENDALTRSLQERSTMLMKLNEEKSQAEAEIEVLKSNIHSCEREISSLKYEVHIVTKELEIRNEEKNMSVRSADVANKQHLEDVKKMTKLEAECQRLRGLVRKKLPGPAALAQMKHEVESFGRDYGDSRLRRSSGKCSSPRVGLVSEFGLDNMHQCHRENELLTARQMAMEEETMILKEALLKRNSELQASRSIFAKTASRLRKIEVHTQGLHHQDNSSKYMGSPIGSFLGHNGSYAPSVISMSEDGIEEDGMFITSYTAMIPEVPRHRKEKSVDNSSVTHLSSQMDLMDDFLEMEKLACVPAVSDCATSVSDGTMEKDKSGGSAACALLNIAPEEFNPSREQPANSDGKQRVMQVDSNDNEIAIFKLQTRILSVFDSHVKSGNLAKIFNDIKHILNDLQEELPHVTEHCIDEGIHLNCDRNFCHEGKSNVISTEVHITENLRKAIGNIHNFIAILDKESRKLHGWSFGDHVEDESIRFSAVVDKFLSNESSADDVILALSHVLCNTKGLDTLIVPKGGEEESISPDCIDKTTLLENSVLHQEHEKDGSIDFSPNPEIPQEVSSGSSFRACSIEDFTILQKDRENLAMDLARCTESVDQMKQLLLDTEQEVTQLKSSLSNSEKSNSLAETQLKCMAESYKSLEARFREMELELNRLSKEAEILSNELQRERQAHQEDLNRYKDLKKEMERNKKILIQQKDDNDTKLSQPANSDGKQRVMQVDSNDNEIAIFKLQTRILSVFDSHVKSGNLAKIFNDIKHILNDLQEELPHVTEHCIDEGIHLNCDRNFCHEGKSNVISTEVHITENLRKAIGNIHNFIAILDKESRKLHGWSFGDHVEDESIRFSAVVDKFLSNESSADDVILALSHVLCNTKGLDTLIVPKGGEEESISPDCIDKTTLLENSVLHQEHEKDGSIDFSPNPEIPQEVSSGSSFRACSIEDFTILQKDRENLAMDLARCTESVDQMKQLLLDTEQEVTQLKSSLSNSEKSNSLAETQLKCMAESYKSLEARFREMELELNRLSKEAEILSNELQRERQAHQEDLNRYKDLKKEMERNKKILIQQKDDNDTKLSQEREIASATEKLEQCQETMLLLGRQLKTLQPQSDLTSPSPSGSISSNDPSKSHGVSQFSRQWNNADSENLASILQRTGEESPLRIPHSQPLPSETEVIPIISSPISLKRSKHRSSLSSSSSSSIVTPEKQSRGFSRFFSKGKGNH